MNDIIRAKFDTILLFLLVLAFAGASIHFGATYLELCKEVLAAFLALVSRDVIAKVKSSMDSK